MITALFVTWYLLVAFFMAGSQPRLTDLFADHALWVRRLWVLALGVLWPVWVAGLGVVAVVQAPSVWSEMTSRRQGRL